MFESAKQHFFKHCNTDCHLPPLFARTAGHGPQKHVNYIERKIAYKLYFKISTCSEAVQTKIRNSKLK